MEIDSVDKAIPRLSGYPSEFENYKSNMPLHNRSFCNSTTATGTSAKVGYTKKTLVLSWFSKLCIL